MSSRVVRSANCKVQRERALLSSPLFEIGLRGRGHTFDGRCRIAVGDCLVEAQLALGASKNLLLDCALGHEPDDPHRPAQLPLESIIAGCVRDGLACFKGLVAGIALGLAHAVTAVLGLPVVVRVKVDVMDDHRVGRGQIDAHAA